MEQITTWEAALEYALRRRSEGGTYRDIARELTERGYTSALTGRPVVELSVRHMLIHDKRGPQRDPLTGRRPASRSAQTEAASTAPRHQSQVTSAKSVGSVSAADLVPAIKNIVYMNDVTDELKIRLLKAMFTEAGR